MGMLGFNATGVELSETRWKASCDALAALKLLKTAEIVCPHQELPHPTVRSLELVCGSLLDVDFTDADVVFVNSPMFSIGLVDEMADICRWMKPGSIIVCFQN